MIKKLFSYSPIIVLCGILFAGFLITPSELPKRTLCFFHIIFGFDCPGCGMTRAFLLIPQGDFLEALKLNGASIFLYVLFFFMLISLVLKKTKIAWVDNNYFKKIRCFNGYVVLFVLFGHWMYKTYMFFSEQTFMEYIHTLIQSQKIWQVFV